MEPSQVVKSETMEDAKKDASCIVIDECCSSQLIGSPPSSSTVGNQSTTCTDSKLWENLKRACIDAGQCKKTFDKDEMAVSSSDIVTDCVAKQNNPVDAAPLSQESSRSGSSNIFVSAQQAQDNSPGYLHMPIDILLINKIGSKPSKDTHIQSSSALGYLVESISNGLSQEEPDSMLFGSNLQASRMLDTQSSQLSSILSSNDFPNKMEAQAVQDKSVKKHYLGSEEQGAKSTGAVPAGNLRSYKHESIAAAGSEPSISAQADQLNMFQKKKQRRKKHRPKVELFKPSRIPTDASSKIEKVRRTYIRKKKSVSTSNNFACDESYISVADKSSLLENEGTGFCDRSHFGLESQSLRIGSVAALNTKNIMCGKILSSDIPQIYTVNGSGHGLQHGNESKPVEIAFDMNDSQSETLPEKPSLFSRCYRRNRHKQYLKNLADVSNNINGSDLSRVRTDSNTPSSVVTVQVTGARNAERILREKFQPCLQVQEHPEPSTRKINSLRQSNLLTEKLLQEQALGQCMNIKKKRSTQFRKRSALSLNKLWSKVSIMMYSRQPLTCAEALCASTSIKLVTRKRTKRIATKAMSELMATPSLTKADELVLLPHIFQPSRISLHCPLESVPYPSTSLTQYTGSSNNVSIRRHGNMSSFSFATVPLEDPLSILAWKFKNLTLSSEISNTFREKELDSVQTAGMVVPYTDPLIKKKRPRAEVHLDDESSRVWKLLMDTDAVPEEESDAAKEKWWEQERHVFEGRTSSFIARMRLVQGERKFSPWKGSVVDSVVGVFLTQNVADNLSSSAFMSLAAKYPAKSNNDVHVKETAGDVSTSAAVNESAALEELSSSKNSPALEAFSTVGAYDMDAAEAVKKINNREDVQMDCSVNMHHHVESTTTAPKEPAVDMPFNASPKKRIKGGKKKSSESFDWDSLRKEACINGYKKERSTKRNDSLDWEAVRLADVNEVSQAIRERGMNNVLAGRIKAFLDRMVNDHGSIDLEWLRDIPPQNVKDYLLSVRGLGIKSVECVRLLTLHHLAFPVDVNVGRICVRLGWVPLKPLPESLQLHLLELYPMQETIQKYLWPRLCKLDQRTLYELHYHMITFGKVFCTKVKPNCNACPMRGDCKHFASAFASARLALPGPEERRLVSTTHPFTPQNSIFPTWHETAHHQIEGSDSFKPVPPNNSQPIIEEPASPEAQQEETVENDIEDFFSDPDEIPIIKLNMEAFAQNIEECIKDINKDMRTEDIAKALITISSEAAPLPVPKLKNVHRLRTEHYVYVLPDSHALLQRLALDLREPDDPCPYLLIVWPAGSHCSSHSECCSDEMCQTCTINSEQDSRYVNGTILIPCRTAMRGSFPLNGTYFQVNEVFADHASSTKPIAVPSEEIWDLERRVVYMGTSVTTIFKGLTTEEIQRCFWRGFICVRGFDRASRAPRPLVMHLHLQASKKTRSSKMEPEQGGSGQ